MHHMKHHPHTLIADFTTGNVNRQLITFAMPMFLSHLLQIVYNMADMIIVGQTLGQVGLSAISVGRGVHGGTEYWRGEVRQGAADCVCSVPHHDCSGCGGFPRHLFLSGTGLRYFHG